MAAPEHELGFDLFGTRVRVLVGPGPSYAFDPARAAARVRARLEAHHRALTRFDRDSELSRLNARAGAEVRVSSMLAGAVQAALETARLSRGLVDPTLLDDLERAGYASSRAGHTPAPLAAAIAAAPPRRSAVPRAGAGWAGIEVDAERGTVRLPPEVRIDLGGTAKGWAVDRAAELLAGAGTFVVDAGGDIRIGGTERAVRTVHVDHPLREGPAHHLGIRGGAVATSGLGTRLWCSGAGFAHHVLDPGRGVPAWTGVVQATALAPTTLAAERLAKVALLRGPRAGLDVLARHGGALVLDDGRLVLAGRLAATRPRRRPLAA